MHPHSKSSSSNGRSSSSTEFQFELPLPIQTRLANTCSRTADAVERVNQVVVVMVVMLMMVVVVLVVVEVMEGGVVEMIDGKRVAAVVVGVVTSAVQRVCWARGGNPKSEGEGYGVLRLAVVSAVLGVMLGVPGSGWVGKNAIVDGVAALLLLGEVVWRRGRGGEGWGSGADERVGVGVVVVLAVVVMQHEIIC